MKVEEVDDSINFVIEAGKMCGRLQQEFAISKESFLWISDAIKNLVEDGKHSEDELIAHITGYVMGYSRAVYDIASMHVQKYGAGIDGR